MGSGGTRALWPADPALVFNVPLLTLRFGWFLWVCWILLVGLFVFCLVVVVEWLLYTTTTGVFLGPIGKQIEPFLYLSVTFCAFFVYCFVWLLWKLLSTTSQAPRFGL